MRILYALLLLFAFTLTEAGDTTLVPAPVTAATIQSAEQSCAESAAKGAASGQVAQGGDCCKGHKGVCGCRAGKIVCCDKTFDASCACHQDDPLATL